MPDALPDMLPWRADVAVRAATLGAVLLLHAVLLAVFVQRSSEPPSLQQAEPLRVSIVQDAKPQPEPAPFIPEPPAPSEPRPPAPTPPPEQPAVAPAPPLPPPRAHRATERWPVPAQPPRPDAPQHPTPRTEMAPAPPTPAAPPAPAAAATTGLTRVGGSCRTPEYPAVSLRLGEAGTVVVLLLVGADGAVKRATVATSSGFGRLDDAAVRALGLCRFTPASAGGVPREAVTSIRYTFKP